MRRILLVTLFVIVVQLLYAQKKKDNVFQSDTTLYVGVDILPGKGKEAGTHVSIAWGKRLETYMAKDADKYRVNQIDYISRYIEINGKGNYYFLEVLAQDEQMTLYYLKTQQMQAYFLDKDGEFRMLDENGTAYYAYLVEKAKQHPHFKISKLGKNGLSRYHMRNEFQAVETNNINLLRTFQWGVLLAGGMSTFPSKAKEYDGDTDMHLTVGLFADVILAHGFSFHPEAMIMKDSWYGESISPADENFVSEIIVNRTALHLPLYFRYTWVHMKSKHLPWIQIGPYVGYSFKTNSKERVKRNANSASVIEEIDPGTEKYIYGVSAGLGYKFQLNNKYSIYPGVNYSFINTGIKKEWSHRLMISTAFNF